MADQENIDLRTMIRDLAKRRDSVDRRQLYFALVKANVWTPVAANSAVGEVQPADLHPLDREALGGLASFAVFTHQASAELWQAEEAGSTMLRLEGIEFSTLLPILLDAGAGSLYLNPAARFSGELYRHELETMADGLRVLRRRTQMAQHREEAIDEPPAAEAEPSLFERLLAWIK